MSTNEFKNKSNDLYIFKYLNPYDNNKFSNMSGLDLQDLIYYINNSYLELRQKIGFDETITFGLELEFEYSEDHKIFKKLTKYFQEKGWKFKNDGSLSCGGEINSPILTNTEDTWKDLNRVCEVVSNNAEIGRNSGGHIHVGTQVLGNKIDSWLNFIKIWSVYENIIYRFVYGSYLSARPGMMRYAQPLQKKFIENYKEIKIKRINELDKIINIIGNNQRYQAVNFKNVKEFDTFSRDNTIEFRCPNGTLNPVIWQNNVNLLINLLLYSNNVSFNDDIIDKRHRLNKNKYSSLRYYNEIYIDQALELCDMLFDNNLDKVYFLRQYFKSFEIASPDQELQRCKEFTKVKK